MRKVFSSNEIAETMLVRDALVQHGVDVSIQNENSGRSPIPGFRPPAEIWLDDDKNFERARKIVVDTLATIDSAAEAPPWACSGCGEENPAAFDLCWNCGQARDRSGAAPP